jgi:hypothetical protein
MITITMTAAETAIYDNGTDAEQRALMASLRDRARAARQADETVEICTDDGVVAEVVQD